MKFAMAWQTTALARGHQANVHVRLRRNGEPMSRLWPRYAAETGPAGRGMLQKDVKSIQNSAEPVGVLKSVRAG